MGHFLNETKKYIKKNIKGLLLFEMLYISVFIIVMIPFFSWSLQKMLKISGFSYLTIDNIDQFLKSPFTILYGLVLALIISFFLLYEIICLIVFCLSCIQKRKIGVTQIIVPSFVKLFHLLKNRKNILLPLFALVNGLVIGSSLIYYSIDNMRIPSYIMKTLLNDKRGLYGIITFFIILVYLTFRGLFTIHFCVIEGKTLGEAYKNSKLLEKRHILHIIKYLLVYNIVLAIGYAIIYVLIAFITGLFAFYGMDDSSAIVVFINLMERMNLFFIIIVALITFVVNYAIITRLFITYKEENRYLGYEIEKIQEKIADSIDEERLEKSLTKRYFFIRRGRYIRLLSIVALVVILVNCYYLFTGFYRNAFIETDSLFGTYITAHRGAVKEAPENTLPAISKAMDSIADYAEIDVQETKDGIVILLHDSSLKRTCGVNKYIWNVTYEDLLKYNAAATFTKDFEVTTIPTLAEVLQLCKGRIKLNIEIKMTSHQQNLVEKVVALIDEYDFERECVVTSTSYSALAKIKELNDNIKTGYILSITYGYFYDSEYADFFSVKSSFINESMVRMAHNLGKEVHAWTVNSKSEIERMKQLGVDNIITDKPIMVREILYGEGAIATFKELMETILK